EALREGLGLALPRAAAELVENAELHHVYASTCGRTRLASHHASTVPASRMRPRAIEYTGDGIPNAPREVGGGEGARVQVLQHDVARHQERALRPRLAGADGAGGEGGGPHLHA